MASPPSPGAVQLADQYRTVACLGENDYATTYWAKRIEDGRHVVVKIPGPRLLDQPGFGFQLERAGLELLRVKHPHIVRVLDAGRAGGAPYVVTEHVGGENLAQVLVGRARTQNPTQIYAWLLDIAEALDFIHAKKVVHDGVRPTHVFCAAKDHWRIGDFAFSAAIAGLDPEARAALASRRPGYTAPEIEEGGVPTPHSDQYALACCVYQAVTGETPDGDRAGWEEALRAHLSPEATEDVLRALGEVPGDRFASCYEFARSFGLERKRLRRTNGAALPAPEPLTADAPEDMEAAVPLDVTDLAPPALAYPPHAAASEADAPEGARLWRLRMGAGDRYARLGREGGFVAAGWEELGSLEEIADADERVALPTLVERYEQAYGNSGAAARVGAGQVWRFLSEMRPGDLVLVPNLPEDVLHLGRIEGDHEWLRTPTDGCRLPRRRPVTWLNDFPLAQVPNAIARRLEGAEPLVNLDGHLRLARELLRGEVASAAGNLKESELLQRIVDSLYAIEIDEFPAFLRGLFAALRYDAEVLPGRSDESWEALGRVSAQGLAEVVLRVAIERSRRELDVEAVFAARGALATDEQGAILTLGRFTPRARSEATARGKKTIRLIDGPTLAALALERWEDLPPTVRAVLGVRRVERTTVAYHFEPTSS